MSAEEKYLSALQKIKRKDVEVLLKKAYRGIWETAIKKYSDSAHFVYELLQNADDAKASWVEFTLEKDGLWFSHNGSVRFTISDPEKEDGDSESGRLGHINAITSIGNSNKIDEQKIGKFGIGFKAVFAYSQNPHIYDGKFNFKLDNYIVPVAIPDYKARHKRGETLFYFPFNHPAKPKKDAYKDIEEKLEELFQPILFLAHLQKIQWTSIEKQGKYSKKQIQSETFKKTGASLVETTNVNNGKARKERIWLFSRQMEHTISTSSHRIAVGFFVSPKHELQTGRQYEAFCFFQTKEETKLGFIIQAPFLLTDSREGIKAGEQWNIDLIQMVAGLAADSLDLIRQIGARDKTYLLNDSILELIPYKESDFPDISSKAKLSFRPFYNTIFEKFQVSQLLPGRAGNYFTTAKAYWASDPELAELFSDKQISELMENPKSGLVFVSKGQKQLNQANKALEAYISAIVTDTLDPKKLLRRITAAFMEAQTDEWLLKFYAYLGGRKSLWDDKEKMALKRPILLNQDRKAVIPFSDEHGTHNIFLPADRPTSYDTVYKPFVEHEEALEFFKGLGLGKPDLKAEIFKTIIPKYKNGFDHDTDTVLLHFESFLSYYEICPALAQPEYISKLKQLPFVAARNPGSDEKPCFRSPDQVYFYTDKLAAYFANSATVYFLDQEFYTDIIRSSKKDTFYSFLSSLGVSAVPKIKEVPYEVTAESKERFALEEYEVSHTYSRNQSIADKEMDGLADAVKAISPDLSVIIWDYLLGYLRDKPMTEAVFSGIFQFVPKWNSYSKAVDFDSTLVSILKNDRWLFDKNGNLAAAGQLSRETLSLHYNIDDASAGKLLDFLGIENPEAGLGLTEEQSQALRLGQKLIREGVTQAELAEFINMLARKRSAASPQSEDETEIPVNDAEIDNMLSQIKKGIRKKMLSDAKTGSSDEPELPVEEAEAPADQDEYTKPSVDLQKKIDKLKAQAEAEIEDLTRIEKLNEIVNTSGQYTFAWFKALLELEYLSSSEANSQGKQISIQFSKVEREEGTDRILIIKHPNRYIPQSIEDIGDLQIRFYYGNESRSVTVEVVSVKEYSLRAKLKKPVDISDIDLDKVSRLVIDVKNPVFILEELRKSFGQLGFDDTYNLQQNLTKDIRFIFGPPGTGKTTYLATDEIIPLMCREEELKVLVLTPTNKAADVLTRRIIEKMDGDESYYNWLLRFGNTADATLENSSILVDKSFDIRKKPRNTTITTVARFAYDYFQPPTHNERLHLKFLQWDYIIIDEASMVNLASIAYVLYQKAGSFFIIAGDPFQIQPITQIDQWKDMNIYSMVQLDKFVDPVTVPHQYKVVNLKKQYRSVPSIGQVFSFFTYGGILEHYRTEAEQKPLNIPGMKFRDLNIIKFPVSTYESIFKPNTLNKSNYQVYSALFTVEFIQRLAGQIAATHEGKYRIGVICPYKAQATLVEKLLAHQQVENDKTEVLVGTIHGFQGDECDIIIAIFNPPYYITRNPGMFLNKQNILNVSISRARDYLFVIMPDDNTEEISNLQRLKKIEKLIHVHAGGRVAVYESAEVERIMFGSSSFVHDNSFATSHQSVNVYAKPEKKYEVRCEEIAIDVQIKH